MKKISKILLVFLFLFIFSKVKAFDFNINSKEVIIYNLDENKVLYEQNSNDKTSIASLTKMMTCLVSLENIKDINEYVTIKENDLTGLKGYAVAGFKVGDRVTYKDLLYGLMLPSGADAALALANNVGGSVENFATLMNNKASELDLNNTKFSNPVGMDDENNYSTAKDLSTILKYALNNPTFKELFDAVSYTTTNNIKLSKTTKAMASKYNLNIDYVTGSKTGYTDDAEYCLATTASFNEGNFLMIVLNAKGIPNHIVDTKNIYDYYKDNYSYLTIIRKNQKLKTLKVRFAKVKTFDIKAQEDVKLFLENDTNLNKLEYKYKGIEKLTRKIKKGDYLGKVTVSYNNKKIYTYKVYLTEKIEYISHFVFLIPIAIIIIIIIFIKKKKKRKRTKR